MPASTVKKPGVVSLGGWRRNRASTEPANGTPRPDANKATGTASSIDEQKLRLEVERAEFEADLGVLEDQRRFLDTRRDELRREQSAVAAGREELERERTAIAAKARELVELEASLHELRRRVDLERLELQAEMARLLRLGSAKNA